jgi:hypothetical protein
MLWVIACYMENDRWLNLCMLLERQTPLPYMRESTAFPYALDQGVGINYLS